MGGAHYDAERRILDSAQVAHGRVDASRLIAVSAAAQKAADNDFARPMEIIAYYSNMRRQTARVFFSRYFFVFVFFFFVIQLCSSTCVTLYFNCLSLHTALLTRTLFAIPHSLARLEQLVVQDFERARAISDKEATSNAVRFSGVRFLYRLNSLQYADALFYKSAKLPQLAVFNA